MFPQLRAASWTSATFLLGAILVWDLHAQTALPAGRQWHLTHSSEILQEFSTLLAIPNVASDAINIQRNADLLVVMLQKRGAVTRQLTHPGAPPVVYGEIQTPGAAKTLVFYAHYDGQPVTPAEWQGGAPFKPSLRKVNGEDRVYARSASDDKAAIIAQLAALDALHSAHLPLRSNLRFVWEGEEEAGSPHLEAILTANKAIVRGDVFLVCDGPVDPSGKQTLVFGARGDAHLEVTLYGASRGLHSGHYGNWAPNPAMMLAQLLAGMKDSNGNVLIPGFYDGITPLGAAEKQAIADAPVSDDALRQELALGHLESRGKKLLESLNDPSLNINGMTAANTGAGANNVVPSRATAQLDLRLVVGERWHDQQEKVIDYIRSQGYFVVDSEPAREVLLSHQRVAKVTGDQFAYDAVRTPMDLPISREVITALERVHGSIVKWPTMGGSLPLGAIQRATDTPPITVPIANHDNNQHAANENIRVKNLWDGIETMAALMELN